MAEPVALSIHQPCPDCGSSDALAINVDGSTKCFSCGTWKCGGEKINPAPETHTHTKMIQGEYQALASRGIHAATCKKYGYQVGHYNGDPCHIANYYDTEGECVAQKYRMKDKTFRCKGKPDHFFGQHLWANPSTNRKLIITEGEIDCLTVSQIQENKYPVVSLPTGAAAAKSVFKAHLDWLCGFKEVVLMFDQDDAGRLAVEEVAHMLPPGKAKVAKLPLKDPNACLLAGKRAEVVSAIYDAQVWRPDDIVDGVELFERLVNPTTYESTPYPFKGLNELTHGMRNGEIVTVCAGSGVGKSQFCKMIVHHIMTTTEKRVGYIALEESIERTGLSLVGIEMGKCLHLEPFTADDDFKAAFDSTVGNDRFFLYDHFGSIASSSLLNRIRFMIKTYEVDAICLDHLSIVVSGIGSGDERRLIDNTMTKLRALVEETKVALLLVSHLRRPEGRAHEEGGITRLSDLRGSAAIAQLSDICVGLERSGQDEDERARNTTAVRVLKNRFSGETGLAGELFYDKHTGRMSETIEQDEEMPF